MPDVISHIQTFRDYFHYHIKASKVALPILEIGAVIVLNAIGLYPLPYETADCGLPPR